MADWPANVRADRINRRLQRPFERGSFVRRDGDFLEQLNECGRLAQALLIAFAGTDITRDCRKTASCTGEIDDRRDGERNIDQLPIVAPPHRLAMGRGLTDAEPLVQ